MEGRPLDSVLDSEALDTIKSLEQPGTPSLLKRVIDTYLETSAPLVETISRSTQEKNAEDLLQSSHSLKSSSANVGAKRLAGLCAELESFARDEQLDDLVGRAEVVSKEYGLVVEALQVELSNIQE
ncbi:MAG: hypothetical protein D6B28_10480 [Gammaproteobacteria bacterium]|nr:MAG: hypothetical protein D6B28_10480 [Gammaproteobacteria bacterium]